MPSSRRPLTLRSDEPPLEGPGGTTPFDRPRSLLEPLPGDPTSAGRRPGKVRSPHAPWSSPGPRPDGFLASVAESCAGTPWLPRALVWLGLAWVAVRQLVDPAHGGPFGGIDFGIHELGHVLFGGLGTFLEVAGGTLLQLVAPVAAGLVLLRQRDAFGVTFAGVWLGVALHHVSVYMGDARSRSLPLLGLGSGEPLHDWAYLLGRTGLLEHDRLLAGGVRLAGAACLIASLVAGAWLVLQMFRRRAG